MSTSRLLVLRLRVAHINQFFFSVILTQKKKEINFKDVYKFLSG